MYYSTHVCTCVCQIIASQTVFMGMVSLIKLLPGAGTLAGGVINGGMAAGITASIGFVYAAGFAHAFKCGWADLPEDKLTDKLKTLINVNSMKEAYKKFHAGQLKLELLDEGPHPDEPPAYGKLKNQH
jgi:hypothetical protein